MTSNSRGGLGGTKVSDEKVAVETSILTSASSAVLFRQSCTAASRTDFSGAVIAIEHSTTNSTETEGSFFKVLQISVPGTPLAYATG
jgi:hypothetical protein